MLNSYPHMRPAQHTAHKCLENFGWTVAALSFICGLMWVACNNVPEPASYYLSQEQLEQRHAILSRSNAVVWRIAEGGE